MYSYWSNILDFTSELSSDDTINHSIIAYDNINTINKSLREKSVVRSLFDRAIEILAPPKNKESLTPNLPRSNKKQRVEDALYDEELSIKTKSPDLENLFPSQKIPRGIAARNNGMQHFLQALSTGIVVKKLNASKKHYIYIKLSSLDNCDTIQYEYINNDDAYVALKEQSMRYNHSINITTSTSSITTSSTSTSSYNNNPIVPDYIAASQRPTNISKQIIYDYYKKVYNYYMRNGAISTRDILLIYPSQHLDPASKENYGTQTLRLLERQGFSYDNKKTYSIILPKTKSKQEDNWFLHENNLSEGNL